MQPSVQTINSPLNYQTLAIYHWCCYAYCVFAMCTHMYICRNIFLSMTEHMFYSHSNIFHQSKDPAMASDSSRPQKLAKLQQFKTSLPYHSQTALHAMVHQIQWPPRSQFFQTPKGSQERTFEDMPWGCFRPFDPRSTSTAS